jgi:hypothetical protein
MGEEIANRRMKNFFSAAEWRENDRIVIIGGFDGWIPSKNVKAKTLRRDFL